MRKGFLQKVRTPPDVRAPLELSLNLVKQLECFLAVQSIKYEYCQLGKLL